MTPLSKQELIEGLENIKDVDFDEEVAHIRADALLLAYINDTAVDEAFEAIHKWYA